MTLTPEGRRWAIGAAPDNIVARVALAADRGEAQDWPPAFRETSVRVANEQGES